MEIMSARWIGLEKLCPTARHSARDLLAAQVSISHGRTRNEREFSGINNEDSVPAVCYIEATSEAGNYSIRPNKKGRPPSNRLPAW